jgi:hypothetical protein
MLASGTAVAVLTDRRTDPFQPPPGPVRNLVRRRCGRLLRWRTGLSG